MAQSPKIDDMTREQAIAKLKAVLVHLNRLRERRIKDLPPNARANARHQVMKHRWGKKKRRLMDLLMLCQPQVDADLRAAIQYEFDHEEFLWQRSDAVRKRMPKTARGKRRHYRKVVQEES